MPVYRFSQILLFSFFLSAAILSAAEIPPGTHLLLRMVNSVGTRTAQSADTSKPRRPSRPRWSSGGVSIPTRASTRCGRSAITGCSGGDGN